MFAFLVRVMNTILKFEPENNVIHHHVLDALKHVR